MSVETPMAKSKANSYKTFSNTFSTFYTPLVFLVGILEYWHSDLSSDTTVVPLLAVIAVVAD